MDVYLPSKLNRSTMYSLMYEVIDKNQLPKSEHICFVFNDLSFIEPVGITVLGNVTSWLSMKGVKVQYRVPKPERIMYMEALNYLDDSQYFKRYLGKTIKKVASVRATTYPLQPVMINESYQWFQRVTSWLAKRIGVKESSLSDYKMCLQEVFNNINDHSKERVGSSFVQHYPSKEKVSIAISDFGVGIPYNIRKTHPELSDDRALLLAVKEGFSTKSTPQNRGAGLHTLIYNVVINNMGTVHIHSNYGILECSYEDGKIKLTETLSKIIYPGTLIEINLRTDTIVDIVEDEEDFKWDS